MLPGPAANRTTEVTIASGNDRRVANDTLSMGGVNSVPTRHKVADLISKGLNKKVCLPKLKCEVSASVAKLRNKKVDILL